MGLFPVWVWLMGGQKGLWKPLHARPCKDSPKGEVAAGAVASVLGLTLVPPVVGKALNLSELQVDWSEKLSWETFIPSRV